MKMNTHTMDPGNSGPGNVSASVRIYLAAEKGFESGGLPEA
jgi:hypothetical protein